VANLTIDDFRSMFKYLNGVMSIRASGLGLYDSVGFKAIGSPRVSKQKTATISDLSEIDAMIEAGKYIESIIVSLKRASQRPPNLLTTANSNISGGNVVVNTNYTTSIDVPFMISLENMAQMYMGDKNLWYELITVNNLQPPYVDEAGTKYPLVAPGAGNNVTISNEQKNNVHIGATVGVGSVTKREEKRFINKINYNNDNTMVLFLSGDANLNKLLKVDGAFVRIYAPHTVNSSSFIKVPVNIAATYANTITPKSDELRRLDKALLNFGVDIAQDENTGDILIAPNGNFAMAYGIQNVKQTIHNVINTTIGELPFHPKYGLNDLVGTKMFGPGDQAVVASEIVTAAIKKDRRITSVKVQNLTFSSTSVSMTLLVTIQGSSQVIPLSFVG
jgi:phage baseplate assembly protein W